MEKQKESGLFPGYLIIAPWQVKAHGGVNGVIQNLVTQMRHSKRVIPLIIQNTWRCRKVEWTLIADTPAASLRLRSPVAPEGKLSVLRACLVYVSTFPAVMWSVCRIVKQYDVRVINIHYPGLNAVTFLLMKRLGLFRGLLIASFHGSDLRWGLLLVGINGFLWRKFLRNSDHITVVSQQMADSIVSRWPDLKNNIYVIHNGVDASVFTSVARRQGFQASAAQVISVASFDFVKGTDVLLKALPLVLVRYPGTKFILVGESGREDDFLRTLSKKLGVDASIDWYSDVPHEDIPGLLSRADLFVLPSRDEGLGLALLEAGATGLPTIATRVGGNPEVIQDGANGVLVPAEDPAALAEAICWMLANRDRAIEMGERFRQMVIDNFSWEVACRQYVDLGLAQIG
jgi:glycosyltransferase involved in cell wall biosynthesis